MLLPDWLESAAADHKGAGGKLFKLATMLLWMIKEEPVTWTGLDLAIDALIVWISWTRLWMLSL
jgi:hypothetical protein